MIIHAICCLAGFKAAWLFSVFNKENPWHNDNNNNSSNNGNNNKNSGNNSNNSGNNNNNTLNKTALSFIVQIGATTPSAIAPLPEYSQDIHESNYGKENYENDRGRAGGFCNGSRTLGGCGHNDTDNQRVFHVPKANFASGLMLACLALNSSANFFVFFAVSKQFRSDFASNMAANFRLNEGCGTRGDAESEMPDDGVECDGDPEKEKTEGASKQTHL